MNLEAIVPDSSTLWDKGIIEQQLMLAINQTLRVIDQDFGKTYATWKSTPAFIIQLAAYKGDDLVGSVYTSDRIYAYVNNGTVPHDIAPRTAKVLHFMTGYRAKTRKRVIGSSAGGASGSDAFAMTVHHPGTEAREFDKEIAARRQRTLETNVTAAILRSMKGR